MEKLKNKIEELIDTSKYEEVCELVKEKFGIEYECKFLKNDYHFNKDKETRDIYEITLKRGTREYTFNFGQSINDSGFYVKYGNKKVGIDRKYLQKDTKANLRFHIRQFLNGNFNPNSDTIHYPKEPELYDILTCLTKYEVGTFENFCSEFGYDEDSRLAEKTYNAVVKEYEAMCRLFSDEELEVLQLIN